MITAFGATDGVLRLTDGESLLEALHDLPVESAILLAGIGMVRDLEVGYWTGEIYESIAIEEPVELLSLQGNIASHGSTRVVHAHVAVAGHDGAARGGHLIAATVHNTAEIALRMPPDVRLERVEEASGLLGLCPTEAED